MHGAGNDFVVVDARGMDRDWASLAATVSDRHFGVGSDGLLLVLPSDVADARMRMFNPDGSEAEMCANGIRCFTKFAVERGLVTPRDGRFLAETYIGVLEVQPIMRDGLVVRARVNQGKPELTPERVPVDPSQRLVPIGAGHATAHSGNGAKRAVLQPHGYRFRLAAGRARHSFAFTGVSMGNPHAVAFLDAPWGSSRWRRSDRWSSATRSSRTESTLRLSTSSTARTSPRECGSEALGSRWRAAAGRAPSRWRRASTGYTDEQVSVQLPGGTLTLTWDGEGDIFLEGPVEQVFEGRWPD